MPQMLDTLSANYGLVISLTTASVITGCNHLFKYCLPLYPSNLRQSLDEYKTWKWRNFFISFIHSLMTGLGSLLCVLYKPNLLFDVINEYLETAYVLTSLSHGYFIYDLIEMLTHLRYKGNKELVFHHILILLCFSLTVLGHKYCGYSCIALLIELSNVFLHFRQLLLISNTSKKTKIYQINCYLNIVLYILIRGSALVWLWVTLLKALPFVPMVPKIIAFMTLISICLMTCVLFTRIYKSDFSANKSKNSQNAIKDTSSDGSIGAQIKDSDQSSNGFTSKANANSVHFKDS